MPLTTLGPRALLDPPSRLVRLVTGLVLLGLAMALMLIGDLGAAPWAVLDQGIALKAGTPVGNASIAFGLSVLVLWIPLRERPGLGTLANAVLVGLVINLVMMMVDTPDHMAGQGLYMAAGAFLAGPGTALYIGAQLGAGPRDGLMTGLARRGVGSIRLVRTGLEIAALACGFLLGGTVGLGTLVFALSIGPNVQFFLGRLSTPPPRTTTRPADAQLSPAPASG